MAKDIPLDTLLGITKEPVETMSHADMLRQNLNKQKLDAEAEIALLEGQLNNKKEELIINELNSFDKEQI